MSPRYALIRSVPVILVIALSVAGCGRQQATTNGGNGGAAPIVDPPAASAPASASSQQTSQQAVIWPSNDPIEPDLQQIDQVLSGANDSIDASQPESEGD